MIKDDRELLAELARLNTAMAPLAMCIMEGTTSADEQHNYALRLIVAGERLQRRADGVCGAIVEGEVITPCRSPLLPRQHATGIAPDTLSLGAARAVRSLPVPAGPS
ncbi:MAG: hypothetical protein ACREX8_08205, partial [Gammaproteobacteria bacterium]